MLEPVARTNLSDQVFAQLRDAILAGGYAPGERLPSERELCDTLGVNRSSIREALKRLEHTRLIETRQGGGSRVLDFRTHAGLDLLRDLVAPAGHMSPLAARSLFELAAVAWPEMTRLAAQRIDAEQLRQLDELVAQIEACGEGEGARLQDLDLEVFQLIARASDNLAFVLMLNSVRAAYDRYRDLFTRMYDRHAGGAGPLYRRVSDALRRGHDKAAARACRQLLDALASAFIEAYPAAAWPQPT